jgi:hypothetical protein
VVNQRVRIVCYEHWFVEERVTDVLSIEALAAGDTVNSMNAGLAIIIGAGAGFEKKSLSCK